MFGPGQIADLRACVDALQWLCCERVPKANAPICRTATARQQAMLMRRPGDGLDRCQVLAVRLYRRRARHVPHEELVVVAARRQMLMIR